jgi:hypothetical protein
MSKTAQRLIVLTDIGHPPQILIIQKVLGMYTCTTEEFLATIRPLATMLGLFVVAV